MLKCAFLSLSLLSLTVGSNLPAKQEVLGRSFANSEKRSTQGQQFLQCYEYPNQIGDSVRLIEYAPNLSEYNFDNRASSCCFNGIWILYDDYNYNINNLQASSFHAWGENYCTNFGNAFNKKASSARLVGQPDSYKFDFLNFYEGEYFMGAEQFFYSDAPQVNYDNFGRSLIVTGCSPWTLYEYDSYQGHCFCVFPADQSNCRPGFYQTILSLGGLSQQVSSVKRGCFCSNKMMPMETLREDGTISQEQLYLPK